MSRVFRVYHETLAYYEKKRDAAIENGDQELSKKAEGAIEAVEFFAKLLVEPFKLN